MSLVNGSSTSSTAPVLVHHCLNKTPAQNHTETSSPSLDVVYIFLVLGLFSFFSFAVMLSFIRSGKLESSQDPYQQYIARDWNRKRALSAEALARARRVVETSESASVVICNPATEGDRKTASSIELN
ncbi:potassium voltage-gated channel subfamily E member 1-like [Stigmatopora nigra]